MVNGPGAHRGHKFRCLLTPGRHLEGLDPPLAGSSSYRRVINVIQWTIFTLFVFAAAYAAYAAVALWPR
jgi:hypothetical protein